MHAYAAAQVKAAMDATQRLGGENYVFWGGREGYASGLLNTDLKCVPHTALLPSASLLLSAHAHASQPSPCGGSPQLSLTDAYSA